MAKKHFGICHLCGINGELTFEHVPPKSAFNDQKVIKGVFDRYANQGPDVEIKGPQQQSGIGGYTLCGKCNNTTGQWYADNYKEWTYQSVDLILKSKGENIGSYQFQIYPLRVIKQIICMFFSTNRNDFSKDYPELVRFVLNKEAKFINPYFKFYAYLTVSNKARFSGEGQRLSVGEYGIEQKYVFSEISFRPNGYIMTFGSKSPDERLCDISFFGGYEYNELVTINLELTKLPVHIYIPADFRTKEEIYDQYQKNIVE